MLILAHGAICDQGILTSRLADHPGVLYDISCFFPLDVIELFARVPAERIVFASDPPYGLPATTLYLALRVAAQAGLDERDCAAMLGGTMAALLDGDGLPAVDARRGAAPSITLSGRLARVYGYASLVGPALFAGVAEQARAMLDMALAACRDPEPGDVGEALETIGAALSAAATLVERRGRRARGDRPRLPRDRARRDRDPRPRLTPSREPAAARAAPASALQPHRRPLAALATLALAHAEPLGERASDLVDLARRSSPPAISCAGAPRDRARRARAAAGAAGSRARPALARRSRAEPGQLAAQVEAARRRSRRR